MDSTNAIGLIAGFLTTLSFVPQALKIHRTKSARDVSRGMFIAFTVGVSLWLAFGILKQDLPIVIWNFVTLLLALWILVMKLRYK
jgi:MtN3 and saliva related transmembrane protein